MRSSSANLRTKVIALLVSLVALWLFAAWVTLRDGVNLLGVQVIDSQIVSPSEPLLLELQVERRLAVAYLGGPTTDRKDALDAARQSVDTRATDFRATARSWRATLAADVEAEQRVDEAIAALDGLAAVRSSIDDRAIDRGRTVDTYATLVEKLFQIYDVVGTLDDPGIAQDTQNLIELYRLRELISQEDALLSGIIAAGRMTDGEQFRFTELVVAQRFLAARTPNKMNESDRADFNQVINGTAFTNLRQLEDRVVTDRTATKPAVTASDWDAVASAALTHLQEMVLGSGDNLVGRAVPVAVGVIIRLVLAAGLGLLAVIASIVLSITTARALVAQLQRLRDAADRLADERLPAVVGRLRRGEKVDVAAEAPPLDFGTDEIGQVGQAFNRVQETAVRAAVEQAELRRSVRDVFLNLSKRQQALLHRQLTLLDGMERSEQDADDLENLFRIDHLATRMRRNAENLIVLSGSVPGRAWRKNVPMVDVARGALQEVEDYTRVRVLPFGSVGLAGRAAGDVIHLLAELIENALSFSPPTTDVEVRGQLVANGFVIEIEDRGLGMREDDLAAANARIATPTEFNLDTAAQLGLFVVSQLAAKHQVRVQLKASPYGGTTAVVLVPKSLVTDATTTTSTTGGGSMSTANTITVGGGVGTAVTHPTTVAVTQPQPLHRPTVELPTLARPPADADAPPLPLRRAADEAATVVDDPSRGGPPPEMGDSPRGAPPPAQRAATATAHTEGGLPMRRRQAHLAPQLRDGAPAEGQDAAETDKERSPEHVRSRMSSYQSGTRRGRAEAQRLGDGEEQGHVDHGSSATESDR
ncbi:nitrate- and nitrite sensing domain-containing protein [Micromonospora sp. LOL_024]|uniref:sensor histidine kinase n=1 Tax=Micromonospora sp. LOL_024 TaxID=3345412 RepID=UPI003A889305